MKLQARSFRSPTDLAPMRQLLMVGSQADISGSYIHPGWLDLEMFFPPDEQVMHRNLRLWEDVRKDPPALAAWAIYMHHEGSFDLFVHPTLYGTLLHESLMDDFMVWAEARAREAGLKQLWPFWAMDYDKTLERLMKARGFNIVQEDPAPPLFERTLDDLPLIRLPEGYTVQGVRNLEDGRLRARVNHTAFKMKVNWETYSADYALFIRSAVYDGERDLFVRSPDGQGASACTIWFDPVNRVGMFEPVGTRPDFQGKSLGKAVMAEGLRRMKAAGMQRAIVGFDPDNAAARGLYSALGFRASCYYTVARKAL